MKKGYLVLAVFWLLLAGCADMSAAAGGIEMVKASPAPTGTPTMDWQVVAEDARNTAAVAQATADEAVRQHDARLIAEAQERDSANQLELARVWQTATYAPTAIPLTMTANAAVIEAANIHLAGVKLAATAKADAPRILREMKDAEAYNATADFWVRVGLMLAMIIFFVGVPLALWVAKKPVTEGTQTGMVVLSAPRKEETVTVNLRSERDGVLEVWRKVVPCSAEMLTEFAEGVLSREKSTAFNYWEGNESLWSREQYRVFRVWLLDMRYALLNGTTGEVVINAEGEMFLRGWMETRELSPRFEFGNVTQGVTSSYMVSAANAE